MTQYKNLFQPISLRHKTLDNRIVFGAHNANMPEQGLPGECHRACYEERSAPYAFHEGRKIGLNL